VPPSPPELDPLPELVLLELVPPLDDDPLPLLEALPSVDSPCDPEPPLDDPHRAQTSAKHATPASFKRPTRMGVPALYGAVRTSARQMRHASYVSRPRRHGPPSGDLLDVH
jgi:hypothetical protein